MNFSIRIAVALGLIKRAIVPAYVNDYAASYRCQAIVDVVKQEVKKNTIKEYIQMHLRELKIFGLVIGIFCCILSVGVLYDINSPVTIGLRTAGGVAVILLGLLFGAHLIDS